MSKNQKTQNLTKLKNLICYKTYLCNKMWQNSQSQKFTKLKNSKCDKSQKTKNMNKTLKKLKLATKLISLNWDKTHKLEL